MDQSSDSGFVGKTFADKSTNEFTDHVEMPCGGFNRLFRAKRYGKWFVLKGLKQEYSSNPFYRELLDKEFELGMMLSHPNIVTFYGREYDAVVGDCIVMECVDGVTLADFLKTKPSSDIVMKVVGEILSAMSYFHGLQVIHRDIKPSNILVTRNGNNVKIIDFGFSDTDSHVILKQPAGTARYAAPEQVEGNIALDNRADIYSFGVVLKDIVAVTGFRGCSVVVRKCTRTDREKRYGSASEVLSAIRLRRKLMIVLPILVALLLLIGIGIAIFYSHINNSVAEDVRVPSADTVFVTHVDTVVVTRLENVNENINVPSQTVFVSPKADTVFGQEMLDEAKEKIEAIYRVYKTEFEEWNDYREYLNVRSLFYIREVDMACSKIGKDIPEGDVFVVTFNAYCKNVRDKYYKELEDLKKKKPKASEDFKNGLITLEEYQEVSDRLNLLMTEYKNSKNENR